MVQKGLFKEERNLYPSDQSCLTPSQTEEFYLNSERIVEIQSLADSSATVSSMLSKAFKIYLVQSLRYFSSLPDAFPHNEIKPSIVWNILIETTNYIIVDKTWTSNWIHLLHVTKIKFQNKYYTK